MNGRERKVAEDYESQGYTVLRHGWPDFLVVKGRKLIFVEVKSLLQLHRQARGGLPMLHKAQQKMHAALKAAGFKVELRILK